MNPEVLRIKRNYFGVLPFGVIYGIKTLLTFDRDRTLIFMIIMINYNFDIS